MDIRSQIRPFFKAVIQTENNLYPVIVVHVVIGDEKMFLLVKTAPEGTLKLFPHVTSGE